MKSKRQKHSSAFKAKVAIEALQERESLSELSKKLGIHPNMISRWKKEFLDRAPELFDKPGHDKKEDSSFSASNCFNTEFSFSSSRILFKCFGVIPC